jgi:hypothetical protein
VVSGAVSLKPKVVIAYPFGGRPVPCDWHLAVRSLQLLTNARVVEIFRRSYFDGKKWTIPLEDSQTSLVEEAQRLEAQYILFIEDDTVPPPAVVPELTRVLDTNPDVMCCGGIYTTRQNPPEPIVYTEPGGGPFWNWRIGDIFPCWSMGFGCQMVRMELFKLMPKPWFKEIKMREELMPFKDLFPDDIDERITKVGVSTDMFFFTKLAHYGFKALAHGGVLPIHWDVISNQAYWLPKDTPPTKNVIVNGVEYGWTKPEIQFVT